MPDCSTALRPLTQLRCAEADRLGAGILAAAAHWADLHGHLDDDPDGRALPGMEQLVRLGGDGTPEVAEFAPAELGAELAMSPFAARQLIADALDLRHRLPRRIKTHNRWQVKQVFNGVFVWRSPHGRLFPSTPPAPTASTTPPPDYKRGARPSYGVDSTIVVRVDTLALVRIRASRSSRSLGSDTRTLRM